MRALRAEQLKPLADELRAQIIETISTVGGHFSSNLGAVELAVALHYVFDTPNDFLIWDVGHQSYAHKILTGRADALPTIRKLDGLSGFPSRAESEYDCFGTAHASTSISAALGMAIAAKQHGEKRSAIAVIGDGAMSGGMAFEALNNIGNEDVDLLVILNDNEMSISPAVGALNNYLGRVLASGFYNRIQRGGRRMLAGLPTVQNFARRAHEHLKGMVLPGTLFEEFGLNYVGPIDGHDLSVLVPTLKGLRQTSGAQFLHVVTVKGKGFEKAEKDPVLYHGVGKFEPKSGIAPVKVEKKTNGSPDYSHIFGDWLCATAQQDEHLVAITPAMREGSGLVRFASEFPKRYFDVGIAEQHALTFAAGLAVGGAKPVVAIYSTFLQRAYDQLIHDIAIQNLPVVLAIDRAGLVGADGETHHGVFDLSYLRCVPNLTVMVPANEDEAWKMLNTAFSLGLPAAVRYPRGKGPGITVSRDTATLAIGRGRMRREGIKTAFLSFGAMLTAVENAAEKLNAAVADMRFVKPLDEELILRLADEYEYLVTAEENVIAGGAGSAVAEFLGTKNITKPILHLGVPDRFVKHGTPAELLAECGLNADGIFTAVHDWLEANE